MRVDQKIEELVAEVQASGLESDEALGRVVPRQSDLDMLQEVDQRVKERRGS